MDLSTIRFLPRRREAPPGVAEKWNPGSTICSGRGSSASSSAHHFSSVKAVRGG